MDHNGPYATESNCASNAVFNREISCSISVALTLPYPRINLLRCLPSIWAIALGVGIQITFTLVSSINIAVTATGFLYLLTFIFTLIAFFISRKGINAKDKETQFIAPFYPTIPLLALSICLGLLISVGKSGFLTGTVWLLLGIGIYFLRSKTMTTDRKIDPPTFGRLAQREHFEVCDVCGLHHRALIGKETVKVLL